MTANRTREPQYQHSVTIRDEEGFARLGMSANQAWRDDPRHLLFTLARYKFVAKMLQGRRSALEVGCGDGFATRLVLQEVPSITAIDFDPVFVEDAKDQMTDAWRFDCRVHDILQSPVEGEFEAAYSLDVFEHIPADDENRFFENVVASLTERGVFLVGTPSLESQAHASPASKEGHVNCKTGEQLTELCSKHFHDVFLFSMNDEVVHTGFNRMAHYLFTLCCGPRISAAGPA